jgi:hypothetical protein
MRMQGWSKEIGSHENLRSLLAALILAGMVLGYFSQANWAFENKEPLPRWRGLLGILLMGGLYPLLVLGWTRLWSGWLRIDWAHLNRQAVPICAGIALIFFYPAKMLESNAVLTAAVLLCFFAALLPSLIDRNLSPAYLICLGILAMLCVELHDLTMRLYDAVAIERGLKGDAQALFRYRVLVHFSAKWLADLLQGSPMDMADLIRSFATFCIFMVSIKVCQIWLRPGISLAAPFLHVVMLPFSYMFLYVTDEVEVLGAWCLLWATAKQRHGWALLVMLFFTLNRELLIFLGPWYFLYTAMQNGWSWKSPAWRYSAFMVIGVLAVHFLLVLALGFSYHDNAAFYRMTNMKILNAWLDFLSPARNWSWESMGMAEPLKFAGGVWLAALIFIRRLPKIIALGILVCLPFFWFLQGYHGGFKECRELYPLLPFMVCAMLCFVQDSSPLKKTNQ